MTDMTKAEIKKANERTETLVSQLATHFIRVYYPDLSAADRSDAVEYFVENYAGSLSDVLDGFVSMSVDAVSDDDEDEDEEEDEDEDEEEEDEEEEEG